MSHQTSIWGYSRYKLRQAEKWLEFFGLLGLWVAALALFTVNLGHLPLRDWDEGTVAQVAKEISQAPFAEWQWLFPQMWGKPYLNKPPLIHYAIALLYHFFGVNDWTTRLPGALLSASSVPFLYLLGRELFPSRLTALFSALVYLTLLPVIRHGRLAMLDGAVLCFQIILFTCLLRSRRDLRWSLAVGLGFSLLCLTKGLMGVLLLAIGLLFLAWDTPRLLNSTYFWSGIILGALPGLAWYFLQGVHYREIFWQALLRQQVNRVAQNVDNHQGLPWFYALEILKYTFPWLLFFVYGLRSAWQENRYSWAKFILVGSGIYFLIVTLMATKLPWYVMPIYPFLALAGGAALADLKKLPLEQSYPRIWPYLLGIVAAIMGLLVAFLIANLSLNIFPLFQPFKLILITLILTLTLGTSAVLIAQRSEQFISILFWGLYISLLLFVSSPHWLWELNEAFAVKPVAELVKKYVPPTGKVHLAFDYERPSLSFYSGQKILNLQGEDLEKYWQSHPNPYLLTDQTMLQEMSWEDVEILGKADNDWLLVTKQGQKN
jgi:4-amino-4-deoxy-L-arabinose transferase-like glycosyltransferase